ncbi:MAG: hypothetical protein J5736_04805, partial [Bacilli bacterium]|nr:hypothetical protein [Bacilli bacterium]
MKAKNLLLTLVASALVLGGLNAVMATSAKAEPVMVKADGTPNSVERCNDVAVTAEAVSVDYDGVLSKRYGIQAYAGIDGPAWIVGGVSGVTQAGAGSHLIGSNHGDGRNGLVFTFKVNAAVAGAAYLRLYGQFNEFSTGTYKVGSREAAAFNLRDASAYSGIFWNETVPAVLPVTLEQGENVITLTMGDAYTGWFSAFSISSIAGADNPGGPNETLYWDGNIVAKEAIAIPYSGEETIKYGIQSYAGISGPAWIVGELAAVLGDGTTAHSMGSNASDGRTGFKMTFKVNSTIEADAILNVYAKIDGQATSGATLNVNGAESAMNFFDLNNKTWDQTTPTPIPVHLISGLNTISITLQENYTLWVGSWQIFPVEAEPVLPTYDEINIGSWKEKSGDMGAGGNFFGLNAFDNAADYGKKGSVTYRFTAEEEKDYNLTITAMAGNSLANRMKITLNDEVLTFDGKAYYSLDTKAGWSGDSAQTFPIHLKAGENVLTFANELTWTNADRNAEVEASAEGAVQVSNWWVHGVKISVIPVKKLVLDTSNAQTIFNLGRAFNSNGLKVVYSEDGVETELAANEFVVDSNAYNANVMGSYSIKVIYVADNSI